MTIGAGTKLDHYEIVVAIGAGGMGEVYRARDDRLRRDVAIKVLPAKFREDQQRLARFETEARAVGGLNHPGILSVFDVGVHNGTPYLVTELLEGATLRDKLVGGPLPTRKAVDHAVQIAQALAAAHDKGIVHRDLKPSNLFVTKDGRVKILDFGIARANESPETVARDATLTAGRTEDGAVLGTAGYMAPEQVRGEQVDHRADIFAFGVVLYEMLSGRAPFSKATALERALATLNDDPPPLAGRDISPALELIVRRCLEKSADDRFQSARDLAFALQALTTSSSELPPTRAQRRATRKLILAVAIIASVALVAAAFFIGKRVARPPAARGPTFQRITYRTGDIENARFAPDERSVVFTARFDGDDGFRVYSAVPGNVEPRNLVDGHARMADLSKTGELALLVNAPTGWALARAPLAGGTPRVVLESARFAAWSPRGDLLVSRIKGPRSSRLEFANGKLLIEGPGVYHLPTFSPDGGLLAFTSSGFDGPDTIEVTDLDGHRRVLAPSEAYIRGLAWHDNHELWFAADQQIRAVTLEGAQRVVAELPGAIWIAAIARDGRALVIRQEETERLASRGSGDSAERDLSWLSGSKVVELSRDGTKLLFAEVSMRGTNTQTYLRPTDGGPAVHLGPGVPLALSPDGKWALVAPTMPARALTLVPTGAGASRPVTLGAIAEVENAQFLPNGKHVVLGALEAGKGFRLWIVDLEGGAAPRAVTPEGISFSRVVSQSGTEAIGYDVAHERFVIVSLESGALRPAGFGDPVRGRSNRPVAWSADGSFLYVLRWDEDAEGRSTVAKYDLKTQQFSPWLSLDRVRDRNNERVSEFRVSADGSGYVYSYRQRSSQLYLVEGLR